MTSAFVESQAPEDGEEMSELEESDTTLTFTNPYLLHFCSFEFVDVDLELKL